MVQRHSVVPTAAATCEDRLWSGCIHYTCSFILLRVGGHIASQCHIDKHRCAPFSWRCRPPLCRCHGDRADDESSWSSCCEKVRLLALGHCSWDASISLQLLTAQVNDVVRSLGDSEAQRDQRGWANAETCWVGADGCWFASHCAVSMLRSTDALGTLLPCKQPSSLCLQPLSAQQNHQNACSCKYLSPQRSSLDEFESNRIDLRRSSILELHGSST